MQLATAEQMRQCDRLAMEHFGIPGAVLMEKAGLGTVESMVRRYGLLAGKVVSIFVGPGNNGGDGLVIARHLYQRGARPLVLLLVPDEKVRGDAGLNLKAVRDLPIPLVPALAEADLRDAERELAQSELVVDAIFGTGLTREVSGHFAQAIRRINAFSCPVVAVDVPSGLNSDTGEELGVAVRAQLTCTYGLAKPGLVTEPGRAAAGVVEVIDIGIPPEAVAQAGVAMELLEGHDVAGWLPRRRAADHKGTYGHLLVVAGSEGKTGAAVLAAHGALRSGVGLVSLCVPEPLNPIFETALPEAMTIPLPASTIAPLAADYHVVADALSRKQAVVVGPGIGTADDTVLLVKRLYREAPLPMVVDADALNSLAGEPALLGTFLAPRVLTPHPGEMARLLGVNTAAVQGDRRGSAQALAREYGVWVVLKGSGTVIAAPEGLLAINSTGNPGMAAGGMGDVLSGCIGSLLCQGLAPWQAACLGAYLHGLAGDLLVQDLGVEFGFLASELAAALPRACRRLREIT
ncbi:MAG: NAD(P)H-hydrate dehydratase [Thermodesulfobacteriota bacterium]